MIVENLFKSIERGRSGLNSGLSTGFEKLDKLVYGIQRQWMTVWSADSGAGKSSIVLYSQIYQPFKQHFLDKSIDVHFLLFTFEMSAEVLMAKLLSLYLYETYGKVISYGNILSLGEILSDEDYALIQKATPWLQEFEKCCEVIDKSVTAKGLYAITKGFSEKFGKYKVIEETSEYKKEEYIPNNPEQYLIVVIDHISLLSASPGHTIKQEMDEACDYLIHFRNKCSMTINIVQQLNRNFKTMDRRNSDNSLIGLEDLGDSSGPTKAAETVIALYYPFREKRSKCEGYDIRQLLEKFRLIQILKNRFGEADKSFGTCFFGVNGIWKELPKPDQINNYEKYTKL